jgi:hypothetical protein
LGALKQKAGRIELARLVQIFPTRIQIGCTGGVESFGGAICRIQPIAKNSDFHLGLSGIAPEDGNAVSVGDILLVITGQKARHQLPH